MKTQIIAIASLIVLLTLGTFVLATRTIPAPSHVTEKVLSNERFFK